MAQARHRQPDALVQGPRGRRRGLQGPGSASTRSRAPPPGTSRARWARAAAEGLDAVVFVPADLEPEKLAAAAVYGPRIYAVDGTYDHCSRLSVELSFELPWGFVNVNLRSYYAEGSKTLAYEIAEQLGGRPGRRCDPDRVGRALPQGRPGLRGAAGPRARRRAYPALSRRSGGRVRAGGEGVPRGRPRGPRPAGQRRPLTGDRQSRRRRLRRGDGALDGRSLYTVAEDEIGPNMADLAATTGVFGETATGVTLGPSRRRWPTGGSGRPRASSCSSRATGSRRPARWRTRRPDRRCRGRGRFPRRRPGGRLSRLRHGRGGNATIIPVERCGTPARAAHGIVQVYV